MSEPHNSKSSLSGETSVPMVELVAQVVIDMMETAAKRDAFLDEVVELVIRWRQEGRDRIS